MTYHVQSRSLLANTLIGRNQCQWQALIRLIHDSLFLFGLLFWCQPVYELRQTFPLSLINRSD